MKKDVLMHADTVKLVLSSMWKNSSTSRTTPDPDGIHLHGPGGQVYQTEWYQNMQILVEKLFT